MNANPNYSNVAVPRECCATAKSERTGESPQSRTALDGRVGPEQAATRGMRLRHLPSLSFRSKPIDRHLSTNPPKAYANPQAGNSSQAVADSDFVQTQLPGVQGVRLRRKGRQFVSASIRHSAGLGRGTDTGSSCPGSQFWLFRSGTFFNLD